MFFICHMKNDNTQLTFFHFTNWANPATPAISDSNSLALLKKQVFEMGIC